MNNGQVEELPQRVRYAKAEILKALVALESVDPDALSAEMRAIELEERLAFAQEQAARWRRNYEAVMDLFSSGGRHPLIDELDELMRVWACK